MPNGPERGCCFNGLEKEAAGASNHPGKGDAVQVL